MDNQAFFKYLKMCAFPQTEYIGRFLRQTKIEVALYSTTDMQLFLISK
jgi:hypothetical protein